MTSHTAQLAAFASALSFEDIPDPVVRKIEDLLVDWFGSTVAPPAQLRHSRLRPGIHMQNWPLAPVRIGVIAIYLIANGRNRPDASHRVAFK